MTVTDIDDEDRLVQKTSAQLLEKVPGWERLRRFYLHHGYSLKYRISYKYLDRVLALK